MELKKILLVDDSKPVNFLHRAMLQDYVSCPIDEVLDGKAALNYLAAQECPDIIFLDINMPVMNGFEFLSKYQHETKCAGHTKIFMLTSSDREEDRQKAMQYGFVNDYLQKPLTSESIEAVLNSFK